MLISGKHYKFVVNNTTFYSIYKETINGFYINTEFYVKNKNFIKSSDKPFCFIDNHIFTETTFEEYMEFVPDDLPYKINYLRKNKIKFLLNGI